MGGSMKCRIDNDKWENVGKVYFVHSAQSRKNSTAVELVLEDESGTMTNAVVARHQIEWINE